VHDFGCGGFGHKIDFVLADPNWRVLDARVITDKPDDRWPSDHYPVSADLELIDDVGASS
jgi:endonuclease/exonuclease/phosphatase family metal-dependent hydrolase